MAVPPIRRSRLIDVRNGVKRLGYACGHTVCNASVFQARLVDNRLLADGKRWKRFGFTSECRHPTISTQPIRNFYKQDCAPPFGVSERVYLELIVSGGVACWQNVCTRLELVWNGTDWTGVVQLVNGVLNLKWNCDSLGNSTLTFSGTCLYAPAGQSTPASCYYPYTTGGSIPITFKASCCSTPLDQSVTLTYNVRGYTKDVYLARLIDVRNGVKRFGFNECCDPVYQCSVADCCGCRVSPREWQFSIAGVTDGTCSPPQCTNYNRTWKIAYQGNCIWNTGGFGGICTPGDPWALTCDGAHWTLSTTNAGGGAAVYQLALAAWKCLGPNTMAKVSDHGACGGFPASVTLTAV